MKKNTVLLILILCLALTSCNSKNEIITVKDKELTLELSYGERTGTYTGEMTNGLPHGEGAFTTQEDTGDEWTYEGRWVNGHMSGAGQTTWLTGQLESGTYKDDVLTIPADNPNADFIPADEIPSLLDNPDKYLGQSIEFTARVGYIETLNDLICMNVYEDIDNYANTLTLYIHDSGLMEDIADDSYVKVRGIVRGHTYGRETILDVTFIETLPYMDAVYPAIKTIEPALTLEQDGYEITLNKVDFAKDETRLWLTIKNGGEETLYVYEHSMEIVQGSARYSQEYAYNDYDKIENDLLTGITTEGIVRWGSIQIEDFQVIIPVHSSDYSQEIKDFVFDVSVEL